MLVRTVPRKSFPCFFPQFPPEFPWKPAIPGLSTRISVIFPDRRASPDDFSFRVTRKEKMSGGSARMRPDFPNSKRGVFRPGTVRIVGDRTVLKFPENAWWPAACCPRDGSQKVWLYLLVLVGRAARAFRGLGGRCSIGFFWCEEVNLPEEVVRHRNCWKAGHGDPLQSGQPGSRAVIPGKRPRW